MIVLFVILGAAVVVAAGDFKADVSASKLASCGSGACVPAIAGAIPASGAEASAGSVSAIGGVVTVDDSALGVTDAVGAGTGADPTPAGGAAAAGGTDIGAGGGEAGGGVEGIAGVGAEAGAGTFTSGCKVNSPGSNHVRPSFFHDNGTCRHTGLSEATGSMGSSVQQTSPTSR
ncbi:hypothetical protein SAMN02745166_01423 [Prosthecobacter debontii]|uniref:Uncharacterized protein n=1 Tax=Prosthecobacter debontii TaxID=48467 RepID=A0A1T4XG23_9BACT|nr:hypothetical protein SAMN02745166_01423 [Prosthecobacter debontii]